MVTESVTWWGHATTLLEIGGQRLLTDPLLRDRVGPLRWSGERPPPGLARSVSAVLVSHLHRDHCDLPSLAGLPSGVAILAPAGAARLVPSDQRSRVHEMRPGDQLTLGGVAVEAVHAEHDGRRHPVGAASPALGFVVRGRGSVFFAGDTDLHPAMADLRHAGIGLALLPVGGWGLTLGKGHLDATRAAEALALIRPARAVPIHWGSLRVPGLWRLRPRMHTDPGSRFALHGSRTAPEVDIVVPGIGVPVGVPAP